MLHITPVTVYPVIYDANPLCTSRKDGDQKVNMIEYMPLFLTFVEYKLNNKINIKPIWLISWQVMLN